MPGSRLDILYIHVFSIVDRPKFSCTDMEFLVVWLARPFPLFLFTCSFANKNSSKEEGGRVACQWVVSSSRRLKIHSQYEKVVV